MPFLAPGDCTSPLGLHFYKQPITTNLFKLSSLTVPLLPAGVLTETTTSRTLPKVTDLAGSNPQFQFNLYDSRVLAYSPVQCGLPCGNKDLEKVRLSQRKLTTEAPVFSFPVWEGGTAQAPSYPVPPPPNSFPGYTAGAFILHLGVPTPRAGRVQERFHARLLLFQLSL